MSKTKNATKCDLLFNEEVKRKFNLKGFKVYLDVYDTHVEFLIGKQAQELEKKWRTDYCETTMGTAREGAAPLICLYQDVPDLDIVVHEIYHSVHFLSERLQLATGNLAESQAYLMGHIFKGYLKQTKSLYARKRENKKHDTKTTRTGKSNTENDS